ncbi:hypothetical protein WJ968_10810 [Achromobacter xylosoxidans]
MNLEQTTGAVADQRAEIATLISNLTEASRESTAAVRQANSTLRDANLLLNNDGKQIMVNTRDATASSNAPLSGLRRYCKTIRNR